MTPAEPSPDADVIVRAGGGELTRCGAHRDRWHLVRAWGGDYTWDEVCDLYAPVTVYVPASRLAEAEQKAAGYKEQWERQIGSSNESLARLLIANVDRDAALARLAEVEAAIARVEALFDPTGRASWLDADYGVGIMVRRALDGER